MSEFLPIALIVLLGGLVYGCTGFGFGLVLVPMLAVFLDPDRVVPLSHLVGLPLSAALAISQRSALRRELLVPLVVGALVATPTGVLLLAFMPAGPMKLVVAALIAIFALLQIIGWRFPIDSSRFLPAFSVGAGGGLLGAAAGLPGPPVLLFLVNQEEEKDTFRATLAAFFLLTAVANLIGYGTAGMLDTELFRLALGLLPAALIGTLVGSLIARRLSAETFRLAVLVLAVLSAVALAASAV